MDRDIKPHVITAVTVLIFFVLLAIIGGLLELNGKLRREDINMPVYKGFVFCMFIVLSFSVARPFLRLFVTLQTWIGNGNLFIVKFIYAHERVITWGLWAFWSIGLAIALPVVLREGFFR